VRASAGDPGEVRVLPDQVPDTARRRPVPDERGDTAEEPAHVQEQGTAAGVRVCRCGHILSAHEDSNDSGFAARSLERPLTRVHSSAVDPLRV
jgi:hypothetical protein